MDPRCHLNYRKPGHFFGAPSSSCEITVRFPSYLLPRCRRFGLPLPGVLPASLTCQGLHRPLLAVTAFLSLLFPISAFNPIKMIEESYHRKSQLSIRNFHFFPVKISFFPAVFFIMVRFDRQTDVFPLRICKMKQRYFELAKNRWNPLTNFSDYPIMTPLEGKGAPEQRDLFSLFFISAGGKSQLCEDFPAGK